MSKQEHDAAAAKFRQQVSTFKKPWFRSSSGLLRKNQLRGLRCLDLCSGNCEFSQVMRDEHEMEVTCADYVPSHLSKAEREGFQTIDVDLDADAGVVDRVAEVHAEKFDLVVNLAAIEHIFNSDNLLRFIHSVLKPDGLLLVNTPNISFLAYRIYSMLGGNRPFGAGHHIRFWDYRFLRTNLFLNGFTVVADARKFYSLPNDAMLRAFRNRQRIAGIMSWMFHFCSIFQHFPFCKGAFTDELTVMARKENVVPIGFSLARVSQTLEKHAGSVDEKKVVARLKEARAKGWLDEHLYLAKLVDELEL